MADRIVLPKDLPSTNSLKNRLRLGEEKLFGPLSAPRDPRAMLSIPVGLGLGGALTLATSTLLPSPGVHDWLVPGAIWRLPDRLHVTFDDGPDPERTPRGLDALGMHGIRAIFFLIGNRPARAPHALRPIPAGGHVTRNRAWDPPT